MIAYLRGEIRSLDDGVAIIVPAGAAVGYEIKVGPQLRVNWDCELWVWDVFSADRGSTLYGFATPADRKMAQRLTDVQGIGPVIAHRLVTAMGADAVGAAIAAGDAKALCTGAGKGLGPKGASKLVAELKDAFKTYIVPGAGSPRLPRAIAAIGLLRPGERVDHDFLTILSREHPDVSDNELVRLYLSAAR
jgi:Holliday junction DNA helicase RuvA